MYSVVIILPWSVCDHQFKSLRGIGELHKPLAGSALVLVRRWLRLQIREASSYVCVKSDIISRQLRGGVNS